MLGKWRGWLLGLAICLSGCQDLPWRDLNNQAFGPSSLNGQWLMVNYWAVWCKPCREEIQELNSFDQHSEVTVLGFNYDQPKLATLIEQAQGLDIRFRVTQENPALLLLGKPWLPQVLPTTLLFSPSGQLVKTLRGPQTAATLAEQLAAAKEQHKTE